MLAWFLAPLAAVAVAVTHITGGGAAFVGVAAAVVVVAASLAPLEWLAVACVASANGLLDLVGAPGRRYGAVLTLVVGIAFGVRASASAPSGIRPRFVGILLVGLANSVALIATLATHVSWSVAVNAAAPFLVLQALLFARLPTEQWRRIQGSIRRYGTGLAVLYILSTVTGLHLVPGIYRTLPSSFAGLDIVRVYAPGGLLFVYAYLSGLAEWLRFGMSRSALAATLLGLSATVLTLSRVVTLGVLGSTAVLLALRHRGGGRPRRAASATWLAVGGLVTGLALNPRFASVSTEVSTRSGDFGSRIELVAAVRQALAASGSFLAGFGPDNFGLADSSLAALLFRFGLVVTALFYGGLLYLAVYFSSRAQRSRFLELQLAGAAIVFYVITSLATDSLASLGGLALLGLILAAALE